MQALKVRRVGNSNVVTLPRELERHGFKVGTAVAFVPIETGDILLVPADRMEQYMYQLGQQIVGRRRMALEKLAAHDRGEGST